MSNESISTANYTAVIADLRAKRDELDRTIRMLEAMAGVDRAPVATPVQEQDKGRSALGQKASGLGIGEACMAVLRRAGRPMTNREVLDELTKSGHAVNGKNKVNNIGAAFYHRAKTVGDVERLDRNHWQVTAADQQVNPFSSGLQNGARH